MIIEEPIFVSDVDFDNADIWCSSQAYWTKTNQKICTAHLAEGRVFTCDYKGPKDISLKRCRDFEPRKE